MHAAFQYVAPRSPLPWLHIAEVVAAEAAARGLRRLALTGTKWLIDSEVYPEKLAAHGLACERPGMGEREELNRVIMDELVNGIFKPEAVAFLQKTIARLKDAGCDAAILGCTGLPLVIDDKNSPLPALDSTRLLARAAGPRGGAGIAANALAGGDYFRRSRTDACQDRCEARTRAPGGAVAHPSGARP
jgi:aspartate racemase